MSGYVYFTGKYENYYNELNGIDIASKAQSLQTEFQVSIQEFRNVTSIISIWSGESATAITNANFPQIYEKFQEIGLSIENNLVPATNAMEELVPLLESMKTKETVKIEKEAQLQQERQKDVPERIHDGYHKDGTPSYTSNPEYAEWQQRMANLEAEINNLIVELEQLKTQCDKKIEMIQSLEDAMASFAQYSNSVLGQGEIDFSNMTLEERLAYMDQMIANYQNVADQMLSYLQGIYGNELNNLTISAEDFSRIDFLLDAFDIYWKADVKREDLVVQKGAGQSVVLDINVLLKVMNYCSEKDVFTKIDSYVNGASWETSGLSSLYSDQLIGAYNENAFENRLRQNYGITNVRNYLKGNYENIKNSYSNLTSSYSEYVELMEYRSFVNSKIEQLNNSKKLLPYEIYMENEDFIDYLNKNYLTYESLSKENLQYMNQQEVALYDYLLNNYSEETAKEYLKAMEDAINQRIGAYKATEYAMWLLQDGFQTADLANSGFEGLKDGVRGWWDGILDLGRVNSTVAGTKSAFDYEQMFKSQFIYQMASEYGITDSECSWINSFYQTGSSVGNMLVPMLASFVPVAGQALSSSLMFLSITGNSSVEAKQNGATTAQAYLYGGLTGASEMVTERLIGGIPGVSNLKNLHIGNKALNGVANYIANGLSEGFEEFSQSYIDAGLRALVLGEELQGWEATFQEAIESGKQGIITSGFLQGINSGFSNTLNVATNVVSQNFGTGVYDSTMQNSFARFKNDIESRYSQPKLETALSKLATGEILPAIEKQNIKHILKESSAEEIGEITAKMSERERSNVLYSSEILGGKAKTNVQLSEVMNAIKGSSAESVMKVSGVDVKTLHQEVTSDGRTLSEYLIDNSSNPKSLINSVKESGGLEATLTANKMESRLVSNINEQIKYQNEVKNTVSTAESKITNYTKKLADGESLTVFEKTDLNNAIKKVSVSELSDIASNLDTKQRSALNSSALSNTAKARVEVSNILQKAENNSAMPTDIRVLERNVSRDGKNMAEYLVEKNPSAITESVVEKIAKVNPTLAENIETKMQEANTSMFDSLQRVAEGSKDAGQEQQNEPEKLSANNAATAAAFIAGGTMFQQQRDGTVKGQEESITQEKPNNASIVKNQSKEESPIVPGKSIDDSAVASDVETRIEEQTGKTNIGEQETLTKPETRKMTVKDISRFNELTVEEQISLVEDSEVLRTASDTELVRLVDNILSTANNIDSYLAPKIFNTLRNSKDISKINYLMERMDQSSRNTLTEMLMKDTLDYYEAAQVAGKEYSAFKTYRTHCEGHVKEVATMTMKAARKIEIALKEGARQGKKIAGFSSEINQYECFVAALWHDTGMSLGIENHQALDSYYNKETKRYETRPLKEDGTGNSIRNNHSFNSALNVLHNYDSIAKMGVDPNMVALLVFAHSKSNSGVPVLNNSKYLSICINKLNSAVDYYNRNNINSPIKFGNTNGTNLIESLAKSGIIKNVNGVETKDLEGYKEKNQEGGKNSFELNYIQYQINEESLASLSTGILAIRLGDANTTNENLWINQAGEIIDLRSLEGKPQSIINEFLNAAKISYKDLYKKETAGMTIKIGETIVNIEGMSAAFILGESNIRMENDAYSNLLIEKIRIKDAAYMPACTMFNINERLGELAGAIEGGFNTIQTEVVIDAIHKGTEIGALYEKFCNLQGLKLTYEGSPAVESHVDATTKTEIISKTSIESIIKNSQELSKMKIEDLSQIVDQILSPENNIDSSLMPRLFNTLIKNGKEKSEDMIKAKYVIESTVEKYGQELSKMKIEDLCQVVEEILSIEHSQALSKMKTEDLHKVVEEILSPKNNIEPLLAPKLFNTLGKGEEITKINDLMRDMSFTSAATLAETIMRPILLDYESSTKEIEAAREIGIELKIALNIDEDLAKINQFESLVTKLLKENRNSMKENLMETATRDKADLRALNGNQKSIIETFINSKLYSYSTLCMEEIAGMIIEEGVDKREKALILGKSNLKLDNDINMQSNLLTEKIIIDDASSVPACTMYSIIERLGNLRSAVQGGFVVQAEIVIDSIYKGTEIGALYEKFCHLQGITLTYEGNNEANNSTFNKEYPLLFSKNAEESLKQMAKYFGDAGEVVANKLKLGKTTYEIINELNGQEKVEFQTFLENTVEGQYLASLSKEEIIALAIYSDKIECGTINWQVRKLQDKLAELLDGRVDLNDETIKEFLGQKVKMKDSEGKVIEIELENVIKNIDSAINKFGGLKEDTILYRAVDYRAFYYSGSPFENLFWQTDSNDEIIYDKAGNPKLIHVENIDELHAALSGAVGKEYFDFANMSTSPGYSASFAKYTQYPIVFEIMAEKGTTGAYINQISQCYNTENEFLLDRHSTFEIIEVLPPAFDVNGIKKIVIRCSVKQK